MNAAKLFRTKAGMAAFVLVYLILAYFTVEYLQQSYTRDAETERVRALSQQMALIRANIEAEINSEVFLADSLATLISFNPESTFEQWEQVARQLTRKAEHIRNIGVAPNDVIAFIYPMKGNERAMGLDYRDYPSQWQAVQQARQSKRIIISGPLELVQGGTAIIARMPVFSDAPNNNQYWGMCSVVIDIGSLLADSGAMELPENVSLAMRGRDGAGAGGEVFYGDAKVFAAPLLTETVHLVSGSWQLGLTLNQSEQAAPSHWLKDNLPRVTGYAIALSFLLSFALVLNAYRLAHQVSLQDVLTKLPNRRHAMLTLEQLAQGSASSRFSIINIDLNRFKQVNDTYGHAVGDALLIEVARRMKHTLRGSDTVARLGGDEFLLILPRVSSKEQIDRVMEKLRGEVCSQAFNYQGVYLEISLSLGVASYPEHANNISELLHHADQVMYRDKQQRKQEGRA